MYKRELPIQKKKKFARRFYITLKYIYIYEFCCLCIIRFVRDSRVKARETSAAANTYTVYNIVNTAQCTQY